MSVEAKKGNSNLLKMYCIYTRIVLHSLFVRKVWSCKTSDAVALQPWRPEHAEDGCGYHFHIGCQGICRVVLFMHPLAHFFTSSWTRLLLPVVHGADSSAGSRAVHSEGEILFYALLFFTKKKKANFYSKYPPSLPPSLPAATPPHRASEGDSGNGGRHPQIYTECTLEPHRWVTNNLPPFYWEPGPGPVY